MAWMLRFLGCLIAATVGADLALAETGNFNAPSVRGVRLDYCQHFGSQCGKPAADLFCRENGFAEAARFLIDENIGGRGIQTLVFGDGRLCQGPNCSGFRTITCSRPDKEAAPVVTPPMIAVQPIQPLPPPPATTMVAPVQPPPPPQTTPMIAVKPLQPFVPPPPMIAVKPVRPLPPVPPLVSAVPIQPLPPPDVSMVGPIVPLPPVRPTPPTVTATLPPAPPSGSPPMTAGPIAPIFAMPAGASLVRCLRSDCEFAVTYDFDIDPKAEYQSEYFIGNVEKVFNAGGFRWQIATQPFPVFGSREDLNPPGLLASGTEPGPSRGFPVDLKTIVGTPQGRAKPFDKLHIRILPIAKPGTEIVVGQPSNVIGVYYASVPPPQPPIRIYDFSPPHLFSVKVVSFIPPDFENPNRWGCVVIKGYKGYASPITKQVFPLGNEICPKSFKGGSGGSGQITSFGEFVDWVSGGITDAIDWVSERYDDLKELAVDIVMKYTFFGAQCELIAGAIDKDSTGYCRVVAEVAVSSGMVALGIPPSLPNYNELIDKGVDHAVELAAAEIVSQTGVPCVGPCEDALREGFSKAADELKTTSYTPGCVGEDEAHKHGREPLCLPDFIIAKPAPGAVYTPPTAVVEVTRLFADENPGSLFDDKCRLGVGFSVENHFPGGTVWGPGTSPQTKDVPAQKIAGTLFGGDGTELSPEMAKGSKIVRNVVFEPPQKFIFSWTRQLWNWSQIPARDEQGPMGPDWFALYSGGTAKVGAGINCAAKGGSLNYQLPKL